jgi:hypothetical protein
MIILLFGDYRQIVLSVISTTATRLIAAFMRENYRSYMIWQQNSSSMESYQKFVHRR